MPTPTTTKLRSLPVFTTRVFDDVGIVRVALYEMERGKFERAAHLCDSFGNDDRFQGVLDTRVDALMGLPLEVEPRGDSPKSAGIAEKLTAAWPEMFPVEELKRFLRWGLLMRLAVGRFEPVERASNEWRFRFRCWDPHAVWWDWDTGSLWTKTATGSKVEITPGRDGWVVYAPAGLERGWMSGLVRSLALLYLSRRWAFRDWNRHSEVHGLPTRLGIVPAQASSEDKDEFIAALDQLGNEPTIKVPRDEAGIAFDVKLVEAASQSWDGFRQLIDKADECIAVDVLGQNLTTSMKTGGSYAAANVHDRIRLDRLEGDAQSLAPCLRKQCVAEWAEVNFGDRALAPAVSWSTKVPQERAAVADTLAKVGTAIKALRDAGVPVDIAALAKRFGIPVEEVVEAAVTADGSPPSTSTTSSSES